MKIIFCETTLNREDLPIESLKDLVFRPSIKRGDIIKILNGDSVPDEIIIVDGVFEQCASITHKEILLAVTKGIRVIGIASMGALRAAELHTFGVIGVGEIFNLYVSNIIEADDEVAVSFVKRNGLIYSSVPLVNIRVSVESGGLDKDIITRASCIFYKDRTWGRLKKALNEIQYLELKANYIDLKKKDVVNYLTSSKNDFSEPIQEYKFLKSVYVINDIVKFARGGVLQFIRTSIETYSEKRSLCHYSPSDIAITTARFIKVREEYTCKIDEILSEVDGICINARKLTYFNRVVLDSLSLHDEELFYSYIEKCGVNEKFVKDVFSSIFMLYKFFHIHYKNSLLL